jgi:hypothetical protein
MKMKKLIIGGLIIVVGVCAGSFKVATNMINADAAKGKVAAVNIVNPTTVKAKTTSVLAGPVKETVEDQKSAIVKRMHEMANSLILAQDNKIWGKINVNKNSIKELLSMINNSKPFEEKAEFLVVAKEWQKGDFTNIVDVHNMVWKILKGTIGKANEPNVSAVAEAEDSLK